MEIKDQVLAVLGLTVIVLMAGLLYFNQVDEGTVAGVNTEGQEKEQAFDRIKDQSNGVSDIGQRKVDQTIGVEVKTLEKIEEVLKKK